MSCQTTKEALRRLMAPLRRWDASKLSLPRQEAHDFLDANDGQRIRDLARCKCGVFRGCASRHDPFDDTVIRRIRDPENPYIVVLGFLCYVDLTGLIHRFFQAGYSDEWLHRNELDREQLDELFGLPESGGKADSHIEYDIQLFFMPIINGPEKQQHFSIMRTLPYTVEGKIGGGGYGNVYRAKILDGDYFAFPDEAEDRLVAIKHYTCTATYNAKADWEKEWKNNSMYKHEHIIPILASVAQGEVYMNFYPLCEHDLSTLLKKDPRPEHDPRFVWRQFMGLLSALLQVHCGYPDHYGYHLDIKCQNILVRKGKWMIADLGIAHRKSTDGTSVTGRRPGSEEFGGPETTVTRKFGVWGIACVGCIVFAWLLDGASSVAQFREDRKVEISESDGPTSTVYNFFQAVGPDAVIHPAVGELLSKANDPISKGVATILKDMLSIDVNKRPTAEEAEKRFGELLKVKPLALQLLRGASSRSAQLSVPAGVVRRQRSRAPSIGIEAIIPVEPPSGNDHQFLGGGLPGISLEFSSSPGIGSRPVPSGGHHSPRGYVIAESVVVPDGGDIGSHSKLPSDDADGSGLVATPLPPRPLKSSFARLAGWLLRLLGHLSALRSWVWRRAATVGSVQRLDSPTAVGVIGMAGSSAGELGGDFSGL